MEKAYFFPNIFFFVLMVKWFWNFIRSEIEEEELKYKIFFSRVYENGVFKEHPDLADEKLIILLSYLTLFPSKEIVKIKLRLKGSENFIFFYLEKSYLKYGLVGCLAVEDLGNESAFDSWGVEEVVAKMICGYYFEKVLGGGLLSVKEVLEFREWLDMNVNVFFQEFDSKRKLIAESGLDRKRDVRTSGAYFESFSDAKVYIGGKNWDQMQELISNPEFWQLITQKWEIQVINSSGIPVTDVLKYENFSRMAEGSELNTVVYQNLDGMTMSVLQALVNEIYSNNLEIQYLKIQLPDNKGFSYLFFKNVNKGTLNLIILLSVVNIDSDTGETLQAFSSLERKALGLLSNKLIEYCDSFTSSNECIDSTAQKQIEDRIDSVVRSLYIA